MTSKRRCYDIVLTFWHRFNVHVTFFWHRASAWKVKVEKSFLTFMKPLQDFRYNLNAWRVHNCSVVITCVWLLYSNDRISTLITVLKKILPVIALKLECWFFFKDFRYDIKSFSIEHVQRHIYSIFPLFSPIFPGFRPIFSRFTPSKY